jgi:Peptidase inhibitor I78 family.
LWRPEWIGQCLKITPAGSELLLTGTVGKNGFELWGWGGDAEAGDAAPWRLAQQGFPVTAKDLVGRPVRFVKVGYAVTQDFVPGRVTIVFSEAQRIVDILVEPG